MPIIYLCLILVEHKSPLEVRGTEISKYVYIYYILYNIT